MAQNQGITERAIRVGLGVLLFALVFVGPKAAWIGIAALVLVMTGLFGFCPVNRLVGRGRPS